MDVRIEVVAKSLKVSAVDNGSPTFDGSVVLGHVPVVPSDSDRRRFFARLHARAAELGVDAGALALAIADIRQPERSEAKVFPKARIREWGPLARDPHEQRLHVRRSATVRPAAKFF